MAAAEHFLTRTIASHPSSFAAHGLLAQIDMSRGDLARARATLEDVVARVPESAAARTGLGIVLEAAQRQPEARASYERALASDPHQPIAANNLARLYAADAAKTAEAIELARTAVWQLPNDADVHDTLGWIAFKAGRLTLADADAEAYLAVRQATYSACFAAGEGELLLERQHMPLIVFDPRTEAIVQWVPRL